MKTRRRFETFRDAARWLGASIMPKMTPSKAKNAVRRALWTEIDSSPTGLDSRKLRLFFGHSCAYCGRPVDPKGREGHLDHLVSTAAGGSDHLSNRVLSCGPCNGDEKREMDWEAFLQQKATNREAFETRRNKILEWLDAEAPNAPSVSPEMRKVVDGHINNVISAFDEALAAIRQAKTRGR
jgi:5-methylcytosine-specific restriction endonuclease McrA